MAATRGMKGQGSDGASGESGANGRTIEAWVTTVVGPGQKTLVQVVVEADTARSYYAFEPTHGRLTLRTTGGEGGKGGAGGDGGDGGNASKDGTTKQGSGGNGGWGLRWERDGGDVTLHVDPSARPYLDRIVINADGGDSGGGDGGSGGKGSPRGRSGKGGCGGEGGHGGHTETVNETVAPLW